MADLRDAFRQALEKNPQSELSKDIASSIQRANREVDHEGRVERLKRTVNKLGYQWFLLRVDRFSSRADQKNITISLHTSDVISY